MAEKYQDTNFFSQELSFENYDNLWNEFVKYDSRLMDTGDVWDIGSTPTCEVNVENLASVSGIENLDNEIEINNLPVEVVPMLVDGNQTTSLLVSDIQHAPSSLPASQTWPGDYEFTVFFNPQPRATKGVPWTYSEVKDKLYVGKDCPCPVNFSVNATMPSDTCIRVMALYTSPEQVSEIVQRCINHSMEEIKNDVLEAQHLIRCESSRASYEINKFTGRHSVTVPFENPPAGQQFSTYIYKFACFGSCAGGPNRRPLMLVFTLERGKEIIGRRKLDVKICACPGRDKKTEESQCTQTGNTLTVTMEKEEIDESVNLPLKKVKGAPSKDGLYDIKVESKECAEFLLHMMKLHDINKNFENLSPDVLKTMLYYQRKTNNEDSD